MKGDTFFQKHDMFYKLSLAKSKSVKKALILLDKSTTLKGYWKALGYDKVEVITEEESVEVVEEKWISVKKFFKSLGVKKEKHQEKLYKRLKKAFKSGDERMVKEEGKLKINANKQYDDLVK